MGRTFAKSGENVGEYPSFGANESEIAAEQLSVGRDHPAFATKAG